MSATSHQPVIVEQTITGIFVMDFWLFELGVDAWHRLQAPKKRHKIPAIVVEWEIDCFWDTLELLWIPGLESAPESDFGSFFDLWL